MRRAVIMAGGAGVRLWPLSRKNRPKQLLRLFSGASLLRQSFERVAAMLDPEQIYVITNHVHLPMVAQELPEVPAANLIGEPIGRDTANAVGLSAAVLAQCDPDAIIGMFTADHIITPMDRFCAAVNQAYETAERLPDALVTMGIRPTRPDTNYGYVRRGERISEGLFKVEKFTEKPNMASAMKYLGSGEYYWNSGMFAWRASAILQQIEKQLPPSYACIREIADAWNREERHQKLESLYPNLLKISIDFGVMERAENMLVVEMDCHWVDVGSWPAIESVIGADGNGNVLAGGRAVHLGSRGNIVVCDDEHLVATIGVDDLVIVHSPDATLVCTRRDAQSIKELVDNVEKQFGKQYI
ncbi:MAG: mannose-1-phosphate guanylyltransferase [Phycisphaerae bacterium]